MTIDWCREFEVKTYKNDVPIGPHVEEVVSRFSFEWCGSHLEGK